MMAPFFFSFFFFGCVIKLIEIMFLSMIDFVSLFFFFFFFRCATLSNCDRDLSKCWAESRELVCVQGR